jgi:phage gp36-like protein
MYATANDLINAYDSKLIIERAAQKKGINLNVNVVTVAVVISVLNDELDELTNEQIADANSIISVLNAALNEGFIEINRYVSARYVTPLISPYSELMRQPNCQLALYWLYGLFAEQNETVSKLKQTAIDYLTKVSTGKVLLGTANDGTTASQPTTIIMVSQPTTKWHDFI